ncbi:T9SS type B sorting domain-containing protein [Winogradskyella rapida]|uniref:Gliding motility-associated C-terminal domain-containing protein n=1 Tax=Winogradskyella rapida TaxID=549701 RepID=A0ABW3KS32_9FLAO
MKADKYSFKSHPILIAFLLLSISMDFNSIYAQCPTVDDTIQSFCDVESLLVGDLQATDTGDGVVWYESATSTTPLSYSEGLINGEDYYADNNSGTCSSRVRVDVNIYGPPIGDNFQGVCLDDTTLATVSSLDAVGNDVQWYLSSTGGTPLNDNDILMDDTIYYADQASPDGSCRTSRLSVLVKVGYTPVPTGDMVQQFCATATETPTIGDLVASGTNNWYISLYSALILPPSTPLVNGQTYYATTVDPPCESTGRLAVVAIVDDAPNAGVDSIYEICNTDNSTVNLFDQLGGTPDSGGTWSPTLNSGSGIFDPSIDPPGDYTYAVNSENAICPEDQATVTVNFIQAPSAGESAAIEICSNSDAIDLFLSLEGTPEEGGTWSPTLSSGTGLFDPSVDAQGIYTYTVSGAGPCANATATIDVAVTPYENAGEDGSLVICDNIGTVDLFNSLQGTPSPGGSWSPALNSGTGVFDPLLDAPGVYTYEIIGNYPCPNETATVTISVNALPIAGANSTLEICSNDNTAVDLFDSLGGNPDTNGTWSPALASGTGVFNPSVDAFGTYTYTVEGTPPCENISAEVNVVLVPAPNAGQDTEIDLCSNNGPINLFEILNGTPEAGGFWSPALASGTDIFDPEIDTGLSYTYTVPGSGPCADATATVNMMFTPYLSAGTDGSVTACSNNGTINLFDSLNGNPQTGGTWSPALASGTGIFDPLVDAEGTYTYAISGSGPCLDNSAEVTVEIISPPNAGEDGSIILCSLVNTTDLFDSLNGTPEPGGVWTPTLSSGTGTFDPNIDADGDYTYTVSSVCGDSSAVVSVTTIEANNAGMNGIVEFCSSETNTFDLFDSLTESPDTGGTWTPTLASGTGVFNPNLDNPGVYTYTVSNSASLCPDDTATVLVALLPDPNAGNDGTLNLCNTTDPQDLFNSLSGTPDAGGTWAPALASGTGVFDPNIDAEGVYTYTVSNTCGTSSASVNVSLSATNDAGTDGSVELCSTATPIDLFDALGGTPDVGGTWTPELTSGTGIFDPSLDASGVYTYTVSSANTTCPEATAEVTVNVLAAPDSGTDGTLNLCGTTELQDLFDSLSGTPETGGTWSPSLTSGTGIFDPTLDPEGIYTYTVSNSCGTSSSQVTVSLSDTNDAGTDGTIELCSTEAPINLFDSLGGTPNVGGTWSPELASGTGIFDPSIDAGGVYTYTVSSANASCPDATAEVTVTVLSAANAGMDGTLNLCNATELIDLFNSLSGTPETGGTWSPALASDSGIFDPNVDPEGVYTYTVSNSCGTNTASVTVSLYGSNDAGIDGSIELCNTAAPVDLFDSLGGTPNVGGTWSPELASGTGIFDPSLDTAGIYTYTISSSNGICPDDVAEIEVTVLQTPQAGEDSNLILCTGDTSVVNLFDALEGTPDEGGVWSPTLSSGTGEFDPNIDSAGVYTYTLTSSECNTTSSSTVTVTVEDAPDATGLSIDMDEQFICYEVDDAIINITGANQLPDGDYTLVYKLSISNTAINTITITVIDGNATFVIPQSYFAVSGVTILTISHLYNIGATCSSIVDDSITLKIDVEELPTPELIDTAVEYCVEDSLTLSDVSDNILPLEDSIIIWYDALTEGNLLSDSDILEDETVYYASYQSIYGCESIDRLAVPVNFTTCEQTLLIPDGFSPNGDAINPVFDILNLDVLYPNFKLSIYNRYGNILYEGDINTPKWDGTGKNNNEVLPAGVYFYLIEFNDGQREPKQGRVYLNR